MVEKLTELEANFNLNINLAQFLNCCLFQKCTFIVCLPMGNGYH